MLIASQYNARARRSEPDAGRRREPDWDRERAASGARSFIADETGAVIAKAGADQDEVILATFDLAAIRRRRADWGVFRDRRPDLYAPLLTLEGGTPRA